MIVIFIEAYRFKEGGVFSKSSAVLLESFQRKRFPSCSYFRRIARPEPPDVAIPGLTSIEDGIRV